MKTKQATALGPSKWTIIERKPGPPRVGFPNEPRTLIVYSQAPDLRADGEAIKRVGKELGHGDWTWRPFEPAMDGGRLIVDRIGC